MNLDANQGICVWTVKNFPPEMCVGITKRLLEENHKRHKCIHLETGKEYDSAVFACKDLGFDYTKVKQIIKNPKNKYGIVWLDEYEKMVK